MGKVTWGGWSASWDAIHQPNSILLDHNLRKNSKGTSTPHTSAKADRGAQKSGHKKPHSK